MVPAGPADKKALETAIAAGNLAISRGAVNLLTTDEKTAFNQAMTDAKAVLNNPAAIQKEVDAADTALNAKLRKFKLNRAADRQALQNLYGNCSKLTLTNYDDQNAIKSFQSALKAAKSLLDDPNALQREIDHRAKLLKEAADRMKASAKDRSKLNSAIQSALSKLADVESGNYVEADVRMFRHAIEAAQSIFKAPKSSQAEIDHALKTLQNASVSLRKKADKTKLVSLIKAAQKLDSKLYTEKTANAFKSALAKAVTVRDNPNLSVNEQAEVDQTVQELQNASDGLKKIVTLKDSGSGVRVSGNIENGTKLIVRKLDPDSAEYKALAAAAGDGYSILFAFDVSLAADGSKAPFSGTLKVDLPVGAKYDGQTLTVLHFINDTVERREGIVKDGVLSIMIDRLSPFAVLTDKAQNNPKTGIPSEFGRTAALVGVLLLAGISAALMLCTFLIYRNRKVSLR